MYILGVSADYSGLQMSRVSCTIMYTSVSWQGVLMATEQKAWINIRLDSNLRDAVRELARRDRQSMSGWVMKQIDRALAAERQKEGQVSTKT
jgi:hypothetical protein